MKRILLCGQKKSGKTSIGRNLALELHLPFFDSDELLCQSHQTSSIRKLFLQLQESLFRKEERQCVLSFLKADRGVFCTGAGAFDLPIDPNFFSHFDAIIHLKISHTFYHELNDSDTTYPLHRQLDTLYHQREQFFQRIATHEVDREPSDSIAITTHALLKLLKKEN